MDDEKIILKELKTSIIKEIYECQKNNLMFPSYPIYCLPEKNYYYVEINKLKNVGLISDEEEFLFMRIFTHIQTLGEQQKRNFIEKDMFHKALIEINLYISLDNKTCDDMLKNDDKPIYKFLELMVTDWINKFVDANKIIDEILDDINKIQNNIKSVV